MKIGIVGMGYVGKAMIEFFKTKYPIEAYDPGVGYINKEVINTCDLAVVCVPTPMGPNGECDTSIVEEVVSWIKAPLILIKSTVAPGTTDRLKAKYGKRICFSPEYIGESAYYTPEKYMHPTEMIRHPFQVFGGDPEDTKALVDIFVRVMGPHVFFYQVDTKTAEIIKYWENIYFALKVTFANEMYECCKAFGVDFWKAREGWALDNRVEKMHSAVFVDNRGYGGKCYPKDISAFVKAAEAAGYVPALLKQVIASNKGFKGE
jgi:nucleotide sugar dehydrogenase